MNHEDYVKAGCPLAQLFPEVVFEAIRKEEMGARRTVCTKCNMKKDCSVQETMERKEREHT